MDSSTNNLVNGPGIPMGLGMALAQNMEAMNHFSSLPKEQQERIIERTHSIESKEEMQSFVASFSSKDLF